MQLQLYKTLWGHKGSIEEACQQALENNFQGIEGAVPEDSLLKNEFASVLNDSGLSFIAEVCTAGSYVPDRLADLKTHLRSFEEKVSRAMELSPTLITCLGACDAWEEAQSVEFFARAIEIATAFDIEVSFETHRGRAFFNPWVTRRICKQLPELQLTCDFSHWCVVCERLVDSEAEDLYFFFERARHIHARVGFDQGAQVSDPSSFLYTDALQTHLAWWQSIWFSQLQRGFSATSMTPEFGPDGYQMRNPDNGEMLGDIWNNNCWIAQSLREHHRRFLSAYPTNTFTGDKV